MKTPQRGEDRENPMLAWRVNRVVETNPDLEASAIAERFNVTMEQVRSLLEYERNRLRAKNDPR